MADSPVFVCGMARSGTTWVSRALGESPELTYIGEAWLVGKLEELADWFGTLHEDEWTGFTPWNRQGVDRRAFVDSLARCYRQLLDRAAGGNRFVEKTPDWNALHLAFLQELFPDAHYVLVYRDGRNCVASLEAKKAKDGQPFDFETACRRWARAMDVFSELGERRADDRVTVLRYEDLVRDFDSTFEELCAFVRIDPFRPSPRRPNSSFADTEADFNGRWHSWPPEHRATFKRAAGRQLVQWKYVPSDDAW